MMAAWRPASKGICHTCWTKLEKCADRSFRPLRRCCQIQRCSQQGISCLVSNTAEETSSISFHIGVTDFAWGGNSNAWLCDRGKIICRALFGVLTSANKECTCISVMEQRKKSQVTWSVASVTSFLEGIAGTFQMCTKRNCKFCGACGAITFGAHVHRSLTDLSALFSDYVPKVLQGSLKLQTL